MARRELTRLADDEGAAATEMGYVFTFLLGLLFLTTFSLWIWGIEVATQERWSDNAMEDNLLSISAAVERADEAARLDASASYSEPVKLHISTSSSLQLQLILDDEAVFITDAGGSKQIRQPISGAAATSHSGSISLSGVATVWVVLEAGQVTVTEEHPDF